MSRAQHTFTMIEVLAALMVLAIVAPVVIRCVQIAGRVGIVSQRAELAAQLGDQRLHEIVLTAAWQQGDNRGDFGEDWPGYHWVLLTEERGEDPALVQLSVEVFYPVQGLEHSVRLSTLAISAAEGN